MISAAPPSCAGPPRGTRRHPDERFFRCAPLGHPRENPFQIVQRLGMPFLDRREAESAPRAFAIFRQLP